MEQREATEVMVDIQTNIVISKNLVIHGKTKHFSTKLKIYCQICLQNLFQKAYLSYQGRNLEYLTIDTRRSVESVLVVVAFSL